ncbi:MAG: hypothetical protein M3O34_10890 [Chloroflexota bacterium]|nr:hypothetical protein [Chloroflexota bacterium]
MLDATIMVTPAADAGLALQLEAGRLTVMAQLADDDVPAPVFLTFRGYRDSDPSAHIEAQVGREGSSASVMLAGGVYACNLHASAPVRDDADLREVAHQAQFVALRLTLAPTT